MSKKIIIIISVVLGLLLISLVGYYFITQNNKGTDSGVVSGFKSFFPFGGDSENTNENNTRGEEPTQPPPVSTNQENFTAKLRKLSIEPVSGAGLLDVKAGTIVRYIEKATGHIFEVELFSPNKNRISNTTIPVVVDAVWGNKNTSLITRYIKEDNRTVDTYTLTLKNTSTTTENTISGVTFGVNITDVSVFDTSVFYLEKGNGFSGGFISKFDGSSKKQIWNSPIQELLSQYVNAKTVALTTKPLEKMPGFLYFIDTGTAAVKSVLSNISGLSTLVNSSATSVLYLEQSSGALMSLFDIKNKTHTPLSPVTFPEKCVWSKKDLTIVYCAVPKEYIENNSLTNWYKGLISFTDDIWKYDLKNNNAVIIESLTNASSEKIDVIKPILSDNEQYLIFTNKIDNALWSLDLTK